MAKRRYAAEGNIEGESRVSSRYHHPDDLPRQIPVFPLRGAILLPRIPLPLNIFEPRYLTMIDEALAGDRVIGIIQPKLVQDEVESPVDNTAPLRAMGGAGRITSYVETDDGRYLITLTGISRFEVESEAGSGRPYRICRVSYERFADDLVPGTGEDDVDRPHLLKALKAYLDANNMRADWQAINRSSNELLVNTLSMSSPYGPEEKQALLEAKDLKTRAEVLVALAEMDLATRGDGSGSAVQ